MPKVDCVSTNCVGGVTMNGVTYEEYWGADAMPQGALAKWARACSDDEQFLKIRRVDELRAATVVVVAWIGVEAVGFGAMFPSGVSPMLLIAGGDFVDVLNRREHIWENISRYRISIARRYGWGLVSVSHNPAVINGLERRIGAKRLDWAWLRDTLGVKPHQSVMVLPPEAKDK